MSDSKVVLYPYTEDDIARGFTQAHGREGTRRQVPIPAEVLVVLELRRIAEALEALVEARK